LWEFREVLDWTEVTEASSGTLEEGEEGRGGLLSALGALLFSALLSSKSAIVELSGGEASRGRGMG
jgi:hypothetical protein